MRKLSATQVKLMNLAGTIAAFAFARDMIVVNRCIGNESLLFRTLILLVIEFGILMFWLSQLGHLTSICEGGLLASARRNWVYLIGIICILPGGIFGWGWILAGIAIFSLFLLFPKVRRCL